MSRTLPRLSSTLTIGLALASLSLGACASAGATLHPRMGARGLIAARGQFGIEFGGARRSRVAGPDWEVSNFDASLARTLDGPMMVHHPRLDGAASPTDVFELALRHRRLPARIWARTVALPRAIEQRGILDVAPIVVARSTGERYWLFDDPAAAGPDTYQTRLTSSTACELDGLPAADVVYDARSHMGQTLRVHLVLAHALAPYRASSSVSAPGYRPLVMIGLASPPSDEGELIPEFADLVQRVRIFDGNGRPRAPGRTTCGAAGVAPITGTRYRVGDYVVYRYSGSLVPSPILLREEITDQAEDRLTIEVTVRQGDQILRRWAQEVIDNPENQAAGRIESLCVFEGSSCIDRPVEELGALYEGLLVSPESEPTAVTESTEERPIGPLQLSCRVRRGQTTIGHRSAHFEELRCPDFLWTNGNAAFVDAASGDFLLQVDIAEFGSPLGPWRWGTFGAPVAR